MTLLKDLIAKLPRVVAVSSTDTLRAAATAMINANTSAMIVMEQGAMVGIATERDLVRRVLLEGLNVDQVQIAGVMTKDLVVVGHDSSVAAAIVLMRKHHIRHVPVVDKQRKLLAVLSIRDLINEEVKEMRDYMALGDG